jgi:hypothetical protein
VVAKRLVEVALVEVELRAVKFWRVDEPVTRRLERVVRPLVTLRVPVRLAALEIVWPFIVPEVMLPVLREVEKRLVEEAVVAKKLVVVAEVPVALVKRRSVIVPLVAVRVVAKRLVVVAWVVVDLVMLLKMCAPVQVGEKVWSIDRVAFEPPTREPRVAEVEIPVPAEREEVATDCTAPVPAP